MPHQNSQLWFHIVWATKDREPLLSRDVISHKLSPLLREIASKNEINLYFVNGYKEHIHCLIRLPSTQSIAEVVKKLKGASSRSINTEDWY
ncbi:IS200/IS605 family transposase [Flammeovirga sp. EKP202]|uniref:IS200/IS605 family transposase n=1 Tax=Flammeovirga sp. EKP202 TaxID=2770592 RepID=UPI00165F553D|nr:IS200/IS605 family transposase [Flammeovirga sp. EKP202]MBD0401466.1 IS200/IS605 family transposase [Flammeovirga sp. EKP202]